MPTITTRDGTEIFYKDWGGGEVVRCIGRHGENRVSRAVRPRGPRRAARRDGAHASLRGRAPRLS